MHLINIFSVISLAQTLLVLLHYQRQTTKGVKGGSLSRSPRCITADLVYVLCHSAACLFRLYLRSCGLMVSADEKSADGGDDLLDSPTTDSFQSMPLHMFRLHPGGSSPVRLKRKQVKNACTNCQKACKKCDEARPCLRCVKYGHGPEECMDSQRKERKKGAKRGPYRKRDGKGNNITPSDDPSQDGEPDPSSPQAGSSPPTTPLVGPMPVGYGPNFYTQFPLPPGHKPGEPAYYPQFYLTPVHPPPIAGLATEGSAYPPPPQFFPATFMAPYPQPFPPYIMHTRPDGQMVAQYPAPPVEVTSPYVKPSAPANSTEGKPPDASKN